MEIKTAIGTFVSLLKERGWELYVEEADPTMVRIRLQRQGPEPRPKGGTRKTYSVSKEHEGFVQYGPKIHDGYFFRIRDPEAWILQKCLEEGKVTELERMEYETLWGAPEPRRRTKIAEVEQWDAA